MGGEIWAKNRDTGGSSFGFQIPLIPHITECKAAEQSATFPLEGHKILAIESNPTQRQFWHTLLTKWKTNYRVFDSIESARESYMSDPPELMLLPVAALNACNLDMLEHLQAWQEAGCLAILGLSFDSQVPKITFDSINIDQVKLIPFDVDDIEQTLSNLVPHHTPIIRTPTQYNTSPQPIKHETLRILVVEDNEDNQTLTKSFLQKMGHSVSIAESGNHALEKLRVEDFDLLLMDVQMSGIDGLATTRKIRSGNVGIDKMSVPIIALTASAMRGDKERCLEAGMNDYLSKPVRLNELKSVIEKYKVDNQ